MRCDGDARGLAFRCFFTADAHRLLRRSVAHERYATASVTRLVQHGPACQQLLAQLFTDRVLSGAAVLRLLRRLLRPWQVFQRVVRLAVVNVVVVLRVRKHRRVIGQVRTRRRGDTSGHSPFTARARDLPSRQQRRKRWHAYHFEKAQAHRYAHGAARHRRAR